MKIQEKSYVAISYKLTVDGEVVDSADATKPLEFIHGVGMLLPKFEEYLLDKTTGDKIAFTLSPEEGYGPEYAEAIVDLPKNIFEIEGKFDSEVIKVGVVLPMMDNQGNQMPGKVLEIGEDNVKMDFNRPLAGKTLQFKVDVLDVRESTEEDMMKFFGDQVGCGCNCSQEECGSEQSCGSCDSEKGCGN